MATVLETKQKIEDTKTASTVLGTSITTGLSLGDQLIVKINDLRSHQGGGATQVELDEIFTLATESHALAVQNRDAMATLITKLQQAMAL